MTTTPRHDEHEVRTNLGIDVVVAEPTPMKHHVVPPHLDPHAREEMLEGWLPDHGTNFGLVLPLEQDEGEFEFDDEDEFDDDDRR
jgi:hypothetical protein